MLLPPGLCKLTAGLARFSSRSITIGLMLSGGFCAAVLQTLYESSIAFGMRKALMTEQGKSEMETHITQQESTVKDLERQVRPSGLCCSLDI